MIRFLLKGILRDRSRSLFPILIVTAGVLLTVFLHGWIGGLMNEIVSANANFSTGHVKIMTKAYAENEDQMPNDLALVGVDSLITQLRETYPEMTWVCRIRFGGLLDVPDEKGETRSQGPSVGLGVDLLSPQSPERNILNIEKAIVRGGMPKKAGEILISDEFATNLGIEPGGSVTLIGSTMYGGMAMQNFIVAGTLRFGIGPMDKGAMIADIGDIQSALDMTGAAGEVLGYQEKWVYNSTKADRVANEFNDRYKDSTDEFKPVMLTLREQNGLNEYLDMASSFSGILVFVFVLAMSIVLWNAGLIGGLRRYGEVGMRLAIGEDKGHVYRSMVAESVLVGFMGSVFGTGIGLGLAYCVQVKGLNMGPLLRNSSLMVSNVIRTRITSETYYIGVIPGLFSTVLGAMLSGLGIYRRQTAQLFKELEA